MTNNQTYSYIKQNIHQLSTFSNVREVKQLDICRKYSYVSGIAVGEVDS